MVAACRGFVDEEGLKGDIGYMLSRRRTSKDDHVTPSDDYADKPL